MNYIFLKFIRIFLLSTKKFYKMKKWDKCCKIFCMLLCLTVVLSIIGYIGIFILIMISD